MNAEIKELWIAWLRSGHKQGTGHMRNWDDEYCCLGGLCEVGKFEWVKSPIQPNYSIDGSSGYLPFRVQQWAGLDAENPRIFVQPHDPLYDGIQRKFGKEWDVGGDSISVTLAELNDNGYTFIEIAQLIERYL